MIGLRWLTMVAIKLDWKLVGVEQTLSGQVVLGVVGGFHGSVIVRLTVSSSSVDQDLGNNSRSVTVNVRS